MRVSRHQSEKSAYSYLSPGPRAETFRRREGQSPRARGRALASSLIVGRTVRPLDHTLQNYLADHALDRAPHHVNALAPQLPPRLSRAVDAKALVPDPTNLLHQPRIAQRPHRAEGRVRLAGLVREIGRGSDRQHGADRLDLADVSLVVDEAHHYFGRRSSSACGKYADAAVERGRRTAFPSIGCSSQAWDVMKHPGTGCGRGHSLNLAHARCHQ